MGKAKHQRVNRPKGLPAISKSVRSDFSLKAKSQIPENYRKIPMASIVLAPQIRREGSITLDKKKKMAKSLDELGQIENIVVEKKPDGTYLLHTGHHRYWGMKELGGTHLVAKMVGPQTPKQRIELQLGENDEREPLDILDHARAIKSLANMGGASADQILRERRVRPPDKRAIKALLKLTDITFEALCDPDLEDVFTKTTFVSHLHAVMMDLKLHQVEALIKESIDQRDDLIAKRCYGQELGTGDSQDSNKTTAKAGPVKKAKAAVPFQMKKTLQGYKLNINFKRIGKLPMAEKQKAKSDLMSQLEYLLAQTKAIEE